MIKRWLKVLAVGLALLHIGNVVYQMAFGSWGWSFGGLIWAVFAPVGGYLLYRAYQREQQEWRTHHEHLSRYRQRQKSKPNAATDNRPGCL